METTGERRAANDLAVQEARRIVAEQKTPTCPAPPEMIPPSKAKIPDLKDIRGVLLGFWKDSVALRDDDKHVAYGIVDGARMRIKVLKHTRDGRPYRGNWPHDGNSNSTKVAEWIAWEDVVLEPELSKLTRTEVKEYARLREEERQKGDTSAGIDLLLLEKARSNVAALARAKGMTVAQLDASTEHGRKANNENRRRARESGGAPAVSPNQDVPGGQSQGDGGRVVATLRKSGPPEMETPVARAQAKAIRSSRADSDSRAERLGFQ